MAKCDVAIVGAGPYGLSAAAHLRAANGLDIRVFGEPMSFWERHMPKGMLLRSPLAGSHLSDPSRSLTLQAYQKKSGKQITAPLPLYRFTAYGRWFQSQAVPDLDCRKVSLVEKNGTGFQLTLEDGESWKARRVIVAAGIVPFAWHPPEFSHLPFTLASHACEHCDLSRFAGKRVAVIGGGQSALESAALLNETGAEIEVLVATGYRVDVSRYPFLSGRMLESMRRINGYPQLDSGFQTSIPGLHFLGAPAAWSFGPLMRFVAGSEFASLAVTRGILGNRNSKRSS